MYVVSLRRLRLVLLIAAALAVAGAAAALPDLTVTGYQETELVRGTWGTAAGQFGLGPDRLGQQHGPRSMAVDRRGHLWVADTHNDRVLRLDAAGPDGFQVRLEVDPARFISHIALDGLGHLYLADGTAPAILVHDRDGASLGSVDLAAPLGAGTGEQNDWLLVGLWGDSSSGWLGRGRAGVFAHLVSYGPRGSQARIVHLSGPGGTVSEVLSWRVSGPVAGPDTGPLPESFCAGPAGQLAAVFRQGPFELRLDAWNHQGQLAWQGRLARQAVIGGAQLIGGDRRGHFYLALEYGETAEIVRLGPGDQTQVVAGIRPFRPRHLAAGTPVPYLIVPARVGRDGQIYVASVSADDLAIYRLRSRTTLGRR